MSRCCNGSEVVPYHYNAVSTNQTFEEALWCQVANASMPVWLDCVGQYGAESKLALCAPEPSSEKSGSPGSMEGRLGRSVGLVGIVMLLQSML